MDKKLSINLDSLWEESYIYTEYDIGGSGHSITINAEDKEAFLDAFAKAWRERAEQALEEDEDEEDMSGSKWCNSYGCWCNDVEDITENCYVCDLECDDCEDCERVKSSL